MTSPLRVQRHSACFGSTIMVDTRLKGSCKALYCLDIARSIDLRLAQESLRATSRRTAFQHKSRVPEGAGMSPPLRLSWESQVQAVGKHSTTTEVEIALYDLGALCITWDLPVDAPLPEIIELSTRLYDNGDLIARSRELAGEVMSVLGSALDRPRVSNHIEDYIVLQTEPLEGGPPALLTDSRASIARILRAEEQELSDQEVEDALAHPVSYGRDDLCLVDWLAAFLMGRDTEDERFVLELATVELLELRMLDSHLQEQIEEAYGLLARRRGLWGALTVQQRELEHLARIQADDALLHEGIDNALKLFGDDYLARLYRTSAKRFHFDDWDLAIQRKLGVLRTIYQSMEDLAAHRRSEVLEWIIIILIALDIVLYFASP